MPPASRRSRRRRTPLATLARLVSGLFVLAVLVAIAGATLLGAGAFAPVRALAVERLLGALLDADVDIAGPVSIVPGRTLTITADGIRVAETGAGAAAAADSIAHGEIGLRPRALLAGRFEPTALKLDGVALAANSRLLGIDRSTPPDADEGPRWVGIIPSVIRLARRADVAVTDVTYAYRSAENGWVFDVAVSEIANARAENGATTLTASAQVNGTPVRIDGEIPAAERGSAGDAFAVSVTAAGARIEAKSTVTSGETPALGDVSLDVAVASVGDVLDAFRIARTIEGTATMTAKAELSGGTVRLRDIDAGLTVSGGPDIRATGSIDDAVAGAGVDLSLDADLPPGAAGLSEDDGLLTFEVYDVSARLTGDIGGLAMTDGWINTNLFSGALPWLGPITAHAVRRDEAGRIAVDGLHVLAGPADRPTFDLTGNVGDLLRLADYRLAGTIAVPVAAMLGVSGDPAALGTLAGRFAFSDAGGAAGIDTLDAAITGSGLVSADIRFRADQSRADAAATLDLGVDIPDYARLAAAASLPAEPVGRLAYSGTLSLAPRGGGIDGKLSVGRTEITAALSIAPDRGRPLVSGKVAATELILADIAHAVGIARGFDRLRAAAASPAAARPPRRAAKPPIGDPRLDIEVSAGRIDAEGGDARNVTGRFLYDDGLARAEQVRLRFRDGRFDFSGQMRVREESRPFTAKGSLEAWPLHDALAELAVELPVRGVLDATFDIASSGASVRAALDQARGSADLRLADGVIGNRLIDLTGLVLPSWLTAPSAKTGESRVECLDAALAFEPGVATVKKLVVETDDVVVTATGRIDFKGDRMDIVATPRALHPNLIPIVSPFEIKGPLSKPEVVLEGGVAGRVVAETLALPLNTLGTILGVDRAAPGAQEARRC